MELSELLATVERDVAVEATVPTMARPGRGTLVVPEGLRPAVVALAARERREAGLHSPVVVITSSGRQAAKFAQAASAWTEGVAVMPSWETLPHERLSPQVDTMARRATVLRRLAHPEPSVAGAGPISILVVPVRTLMQPLIRGTGEIEPVRVRVGDWVDPGTLQERLVALGYEAVDMVERRGQVALRGSIIDVFVPTGAHPIRLDLFGDEVEEIRYFNLSDQRTVGLATDGLWAPPARELLLTPEVRSRALTAQKELPGAAEILELAAEGIYAPGLEALAPSLVSGMEMLSDLLPDDSLFVLDEPERTVARGADLLRTAEEFLSAAWGSAAAGGAIPVLARSASFVPFDEIWGQGAKRAWWEYTDLPPLELAEVEPGEVEGQSDTAQPSGAAVEAVVVNARLARVGARSVAPYRGEFDRATHDLRALAREGWRLIVTVPAAGAGRRIVEVLRENDVVAKMVDEVVADDPSGVVSVLPAPGTSGFVMHSESLAVITEQDLTGRAGANTREMRRLPAKRRKGVDPLTLKIGDFVVHSQHGIGKFLGIETRTTGKGDEKVQRDYLVIEYQASRRGQPGDNLYVPTSSLDQVSAYSGSEAPKLSKMGGADWSKTKQKARKAVMEIAAELVRLYAERAKSEGHAFAPDTPWQRELEDAFEYTETPDQLATVDEIKADMEKSVPMDRLLTGDVGYGKTEVAVRAAFKAIQDSKQVAILVPTTLLAQQHYDTFAERYAGFPIRVEQLSRFTTGAQAEKVKEGLRDGSVDLVIGTHTLLTGSVQFKDLGLVIVDEEQRFGVEHKETLKALRTNVDVLSMSATPIPRTLEMAISGIREMSVLQTPPEERQPVLTFVGPYSNAQVAAAIRRELLREGQVFFVHNRVDSINKVAAGLQELVPEARIRVAHGKLSEAELERVIVDFWNHEFDVLVSTTIVETGLDISNANTLIVDRADIFGLSQLHQLRGRVGRGRERAYAYFLYNSNKALSETALERLRTIAANTDLGAGLAIAQKDLEIRGAGNLLGGAQSGHIEGVGFDLYVRMVSEAVAAFKGEAVEDNSDVRVELAVDAHLPEDYVPGERLRLETYGRIAAINSDATEKELREELTDRFGPIPREVDLMIAVARLREKLRQVGITEAITQGRYLRLGPVQLPESKALRLQRLYPGTTIKPAVRQVLVPISKPSMSSEETPTDETLIEWVEGLIRVLTAPIAKAQPR
ncbi:transcription-repair coupling factor [Actinomyces minihominis]|uniref:transcription-repair coupling factor n=1 Tax=Actinomyces minihominis TaxID=2002838 RepID=UPI000C06BCF6|nr:transcription-repair coupling factor [Actinomyces minihominis]